MLTPSSLPIVCACLFLFGCQSNSESVTRSQNESSSDAMAMMAGAAAGPPTIIDESMPPEVDCDDTRPPFIMAHGFIGAGDTWSTPARLFAQNGHCADRYYAFDWNSIDQALDHSASLDAFIDDVLKKHGVKQVDLVGHSAGGGLAYTYMEDLDRAQKIRKYVHVGSFSSEPPKTLEEAGVEMLNLWSEDDLVVEGADITGVMNQKMSGLDHYGVATSKESFEVMYTFLYEQKPQFLDLENREQAWVSGRALSLGEAVLQKDAPITVWSLDSDGQRLKTIHSTQTDALGFWGPLKIDANQRFEFELEPSDETPRLRYFYEPFKADDPLVYLRSFPGPGSIANLIVSQIPLDGEGVSLIVFNATRAFLAGQDSLTLDGEELLTPEVASKDQTTIALFIFDIDEDGKSDGTSPLFDSFPFFTAIDRPMAGSQGNSLRLVYNGRELVLPKDKADKGGLIAVFR